MSLLGNRRETNFEVTISVFYGNEDIANAISQAVTPDNLEFSSGINIESEIIGCEIRFVISCSKGLSSLITTIDDLLSCIQSAERAISVICE